MPRIYSPIIAFAFAARLLAQLQTGQISGVVTRPGGAPVADATVTITAKDTGDARIAYTSAKGSYSIAALLPGDYTLEAAGAGLSTSRDITLHVNASTRQDFVLEAARSVTNATLTSETQTQERVFAQGEIRNLPNLTRNPYEFAALAGNVSDAGVGTRGVGININGQRESSTFVLLDGAGSMNEFSGAYGQPIPLEAIKEFSVLTSDFTAEFGRASGGVVNVVSMSGSNSLHGTAWEFNRISGLATGSFKNNASGIKQTDFNRNQFGYTAGGAIQRNKLFLFNSTEGLLVHSTATNYAWIPTSQLLALTAPNTQAFFQALGQVRQDAHQIGAVSSNDLTAIYGKSPCTGFACATLAPTLPLFSHVAYSAPTEAGGGIPQNTWDSFSRVDYNLSDKTKIFGRYSFYREADASGTLSNSPYGNYDLAQTQFDNSFLLSATRIWNSHWVSNTSVAFSRLNILQQGQTSRGAVPSMYANPFSPVAIGSDYIAFPGYSPFSPGAGTFGGPQNTGELNHDTSWVRGTHTFRFGGNWRYTEDNRTSAAYQNAAGSLSVGGGVGPAVNGLLSGRFADVQLAINPQSLTPGGVASPNFTRSYRYSDGALYLQDHWKLTRRIAINAGARWEHFGVQHNSDPNLDSNWYATGVTFADTNLGNYLRNGGLQLVPKSSVGSLWKPDWKDFAPRIGVAWDLFGNGRTSLRAGYGIAYERNFGNVTFNVIQNGPNYAVVDVPGPVSTTSSGALGVGSLALLPPQGARIIDPGLKTAYAHFWSATVEQQIVRGVKYRLEYSGSKGVNLYSISYPNQAGFGNAILGDSCSLGSCTSKPNPNYSEDVGYRGNQGFSKYFGLNNVVTMNDFLHRGIVLTATYTYSHAIDNLSSTFFEAGGQGVESLYGNQNITTNNGNFVQGLLDPYHPNLDKGDAEFDVRQRVTFSAAAPLPTFGRTGWLGKALKGWSFNPTFIARTGQSFSIFDSAEQTLNLNTPRATFAQAVPFRRNSFVPSTTPDTYHLLTFLPAQIAHIPDNLTPGSTFPANMSARDAFRAPGFWNFNLGITKDTKITDSFTLQLRGEAFNVLNHANLYVIGSTADLGRGNTVDACFGCSGSTWDSRQIQLAARLIF